MGVAFKARLRRAPFSRRSVFFRSDGIHQRPPRRPEEIKVDSDFSRKALDDYAVSCIKHHARTLCRKEGFVPEDLHDLEQELTIHLWEQLDKFDPSRGKLTTFVDRVVRNKAADLLEARQAACRDCRFDLCSLTIRQRRRD